MNARHRKTLAAIMTNPIPKTLPFRDVEALLVALGCAVEEREGSRVVFMHASGRWVTHRPHPERECYSHHMHGVRRFLKELGVES